MSNNKHRIRDQRDQRLGGQADDGPLPPLSDVQRIAIANTTRSDHNIGGATPKYGDQIPISRHQGEVARSLIDAAVRGQDKEAAKDTR